MQKNGQKNVTNIFFVLNKYQDVTFIFTSILSRTFQNLDV